MSKKLLVTILVTLILAGAFSALNQNTTSATTGTASKLSISTGPLSVLADNNTYNCIFVQLQDSNGNPARANQETTISLSSSLTNIGTVDSSVVIPKEETFASANFNSTFSPGTTTISASATGYSTVQTSITTIGPIPASIAVYGFPSTLPADGNLHEAILVQLQDSSGSPARAPQDGVEVSLSCSDTSVGTVSQTVLILEGETFALANFTTTTFAETAGTTKSAVITAVSQGYSSKQVTITTTPVATNPNHLKIFVGSPQVLADQKSYRQIAVELQNASGYCALAQVPTSITVATNDQSIGKIASITIPQAQSFGIATFNTTFKAGSTTITAVGTDLIADQQTITTTGFVPSKLAVYCVPAKLPADNVEYQAIHVQLQDAQGRPAKDPQAAVNVNLFSSQPTVGTISSTLTIPFGKTQATGNFAVTNNPGETYITAQASDYSTGQTKITTYLIDYLSLQVALTGTPQTVDSGKDVALTAYVSAAGSAAPDATVTFSSNNGGSFSSKVDQANGHYNTTFTAPNFAQTTTCTITVYVSKIGYLSYQDTLQITVSPTISPTATPTPSPTTTPTQTTNSNQTSNTTGRIQFCIKDINEIPLNDTVVSSISQPDGVGTLVEITNATGYVTFENATLGSYTFNVNKLGYPSMNATIDYTGQPLSLSITLLSAETQTNTGMILIVAVSLAVAIVIVLGIILFLVRRSNLAKTRKLQELKQQLNNKY